MKKTESLKQNKQFKRVYNRGKSIINNTLVLYLIKNSENYNRLGIVVNKKVGKAVIRNRVRRLIKENYRQKEATIKTGFDIIFVARVRANNCSFNQIEWAMRQLLNRADMLLIKE